MNTLLWTGQVFLAITFLYSGLMKLLLSRERLVSIGQTGVAELSYATIRFIAVAELLGVSGIILPWLLNILPVLTPVTAVCFAVIMMLAMPIHYKRRELKSVGLNIFVFILSVFVAIMRFKMLL